MSRRTVNIAEFQTISDVEAAKTLGQNLRKLRTEIDALGCCLRIGQGPRRLTAVHMRRLLQHLETDPCCTSTKGRRASGASAAPSTASRLTKALELAASQKRA